MTSARLHSITLSERTWLDDDVFELCCTRPEHFTFLAGQHVTLQHQDEERDYTLISTPQEARLRFLIKRVKEGRLSARLAELPLGTEFAMGAAQGYLIWQDQAFPQRETVFIATGVGIAPFVAMVGDGVKGFTLIHGARYASGLFYQPMLARAAKKYVPCLSGAAQTNDLDNAFYGRVTAYVAKRMQPGAYDFYLCGSRPMVHDMTHLLDRDFPDARVYSESFA